MPPAPSLCTARKTPGPDFQSSCWQLVASDWCTSCLRHACMPQPAPSPEPARLPSSCCSFGAPHGFVQQGIASSLSTTYCHANNHGQGGAFGLSPLHTPPGFSLARLQSVATPPILCNSYRCQPVALSSVLSFIDHKYANTIFLLSSLFLSVFSIARQAGQQ